MASLNGKALPKGAEASNAALRDAIRSGQPMPVTEPEATRYFMTAGEAVSLVIKADLLSQRPETYWLDMGDPVRIGDLAVRNRSPDRPRRRPGSRPC